MASKRILVIGGTGYIGRALAKELAKEFDVSLMVRKDIGGDYKYFIGDLLDKKSLKKIKDFELVINLASVVKSFNKEKYRENVIGLKNLVEVLGKQKLIYFSTINVNLREKGDYAKSKSDAEKILRESGVEYMIVRPNYVYEIGKENNFYKMARFMKKFNFCFLIGNGENKIQPILREDLVKEVLKLVRDFKSGKIVEVSGKERISLSEIAGFIGKELKRKPIVIHLPVGFLRLFKFLISFDVEGFDEERISKEGYGGNFYENLKKIILITKS